MPPKKESAKTRKITPIRSAWTVKLSKLAPKIPKKLIRIDIDIFMRAGKERARPRERKRRTSFIKF